MKSKDRRHFLKSATLLPLAMTLGDLSSEGAAFTRKAHETLLDLKARIKLSINWWSYYVPLYKYINGEEGGMSVFDLLEESPPNLLSLLV